MNPIKYNIGEKTVHKLYALIKDLKRERGDLHRTLNKDFPVNDRVYLFKDPNRRNPGRIVLIDKIRINRKQLRTLQSLYDFIRCNPNEDFIIYSFRDKKYILSESELIKVALDAKAHKEITFGYYIWDFLEHRIVDNINYLNMRH
jgi:hypothetical protein